MTIQQNLPLYEQVRQDLLRRLAANEWPVETRIANEQQLMEQYGVSRITVRRAIEKLVQQGWLYKVQGKGTFVRQTNMSDAVFGLTGFSEQFQLGGKKVEFHLLEKSVAPLPAAFSNYFKPRPTKTSFVRRLGLVDGVPFFIDRHWLPLDVASELNNDDWHDQSIYRALMSQGFVIDRGWQEMAAMSIEHDDAHELSLAAGTPVLRVRRVTYDVSGRAIEAAEAVYHPERHTYRLILKR